MVETFTPAGCGGRTRRLIALLIFTVTAVVTAATLGALLGAAGAGLPSRWAILAVCLLGVFGALREFGVLRFRIPESRRQVPEPWRRTKPLPFWTAAYGVILGSGVGTFQPVITFWVACTGAVALGDPKAAALAFGLFGLGRAFMIAAPGGDPLGRLAFAHRFVRPANAIVLVVFVALLAPAAATAAPSGQSDPAVSKHVIAYTDQANGVTNVLVRPPGADPVVFLAARMPTIDGDRLAYVDARGIRLVQWPTGAELLRIDGAYDKPALSGVWLAYVQTMGSRHRLIVRHLPTGKLTVVARAGNGVDLGRPSLSGLLLTWHEQAGSHNAIRLRNLKTRRTSTVAFGPRRQLLANPAVGAGRIAWIEGIAERSTIVLYTVRTGRKRALVNTFGPRFHFWNTAIEGGGVFVTRWDLNAGTGRIVRYRWS